MMKQGKAAIAAILAGACMFSFAACGGGMPSGGSDVGKLPDDPAQLVGEINVALPSTGNKRAIFEEAIEKYEASRPNVTVEVEWKPSDDFYLGYQTDVSGGLVFPDAAYIDHVYIQSLASLDLVASVDEVISPVRDKYVDNLVKANMLDGKTYGFPFSANTVALYYNKDILGTDAVPTTYEEFRTVCANIVSREASKPENERAQPFSLSTGSDYKDFGALIFLSWLQRNGGTLLSEDLRTSTINSEPVRTTLSQWKEIADNDWANPALSNEGLFYLGKVGMMEMGCWSVPTVFKEGMDEHYGIAPLFSVNGKTDSALGLYSLCVTNQKDTNKMLIAADFCSFLSADDELQLSYAKESKCLPVTKEACADEFFVDPHWKPFVDALSHAAIRPGSPEWPTVQSEVGNMFMKVLLGRASVEEAAKSASDAVQKKLDAFYLY